MLFVWTYRGLGGDRTAVLDVPDEAEAREAARRLLGAPCTVALVYNAGQLGTHSWQPVTVEAVDVIGLLEAWAREIGAAEGRF